jgi:hypothetical protein
MVVQMNFAGLGLAMIGMILAYKLGRIHGYMHGYKTACDNYDVFGDRAKERKEKRVGSS